MGGAGVGAMAVNVTAIIVPTSALISAVGSGIGVAFGVQPAANAVNNKSENSLFFIGSFFLVD